MLPPFPVLAYSKDESAGSRGRTVASAWATRFKKAALSFSGCKIEVLMQTLVRKIDRSALFETVGLL
jgi:hypothetical protein